MATGRPGNRTLLMDGVRNLHKVLLERIHAKSPHNLRQIPRILTSTENAARLRAIAAVGTDTSLEVAERTKHMRELVLESLEQLGILGYLQGQEVDELMASLAAIMSTPDLDITYHTVIAHTLSMIDTTLDAALHGYPPNEAVSDELSRTVRHAVMKLRHDEFGPDRACDIIAAALGYYVHALGAPTLVLAEVTKVIEQVHPYLERARQRDQITESP